MARKSKIRKGARTKRAKEMKAIKARKRIRIAESRAKMDAWESLPCDQWSDARKARAAMTEDFISATMKAITLESGDNT